MVSIYINLLTFVLCLNIWVILKNVPCALEKTVYLTFGGGGGGVANICILSPSGLTPHLRL